MTKKFEFLFELGSATNIQWKTQDSDPNSILFYRLNDSDTESLRLFKDRIDKANFKFCIVNNESLTVKNIIGTSTEEFNSLQLALLKTYYPVSNDLKFLGVTGTNGKTTTVDLIRQIALSNNKKILSFGTLGVYLNDEKIENFNLTTPALIDIYQTIHKHQEKVDWIAFELSSHALEQKRLGDFKFDSIGWTNFTQDHLDYHGSMEDYFMAKSLIGEYIKKNGQIYLTRAMKKFEDQITFDFKFSEPSIAPETPFFKMSFNRENLSLAKAMSEYLLGNEIKMMELVPPPGRFEVYKHGNSFVVIDYAHTPDAIESLCREVTLSFPDHKLIVLFGCGGDRDRTKRAVMGEAASRFASAIVVTNDNPRTEDPQSIADDIIKGISVQYSIILDREIAIKESIENMNRSVLVIVGKGHEDYMEVQGERKFFSDSKVVNELIND